MASVPDSETQSDDAPVPPGEAELWRVMKEQGSSAARESLFTRHADFARNIARRHHREQSWGDIDVTDLYQHAYAGLLEALDRFDPALGTPFRAFAAHRISGSIRDGIARMSEMREQISWRRRIRRERIQSLSEGEPGAAKSSAIEQLAELALGLALGFMLEGTGLYAEVDADSLPAHSAYDSLAWKEALVHLHRELSSLPDREQTILREHYLNGVNFEQLAILLSVSKGRVSQLHRAALAVLRKRLREQGHFRMIR